MSISDETEKVSATVINCKANVQLDYDNPQRAVGNLALPASSCSSYTERFIKNGDIVATRDRATIELLSAPDEAALCYATACVHCIRDIFGPRSGALSS